MFRKFVWRHLWRRQFRLFWHYFTYEWKIGRKEMQRRKEVSQQTALQNVSKQFYTTYGSEGHGYRLPDIAIRNKCSITDAMRKILANEIPYY